MCMTPIASICMTQETINNTLLFALPFCLSTPLKLYCMPNSSPSCLEIEPEPLPPLFDHKDHLTPVYNPHPIRRGVHHGAGHAYPLHDAVLYDQPDAIDYLIQEKQIDPVAQDDQGNTALHIAVAARKYSSARTLMRYWIDITIQNKAGKTVIDLAKNNKTLL